MLDPHTILSCFERRSGSNSSSNTRNNSLCQVGQRLIEHGYISRVSRELKATHVGHFANTEKAKNEFRGGHSLYRFDTLRVSPFQVTRYVPCFKGDA